jgi:hypothetical protein
LTVDHGVESRGVIDGGNSVRKRQFAGQPSEPVASATAECRPHTERNRSAGDQLARVPRGAVEEKCHPESLCCSGGGGNRGLASQALHYEGAIPGDIVVFRIQPVLGALAAAALLALGAVNASGRPAPQVPSGAAAGQPVAGMSCDAQEGSRVHIHQHLLILDRGKPVGIPPNVGQPPGKRCIYWVHTHTPNGVIHIEAPENRSFTLGDFFLVWGEPLGRSRAASASAPRGRSLKVWVNGRPYGGDPRKIPLAAHADIVIEAGPPYQKPPKFTTWNGL